MLIDIVVTGSGTVAATGHDDPEALRSECLREVRERPADSIVFQAGVRSDGTDPIVIDILNGMVDLHIAPAPVPRRAEA